MKMDKVAGSGNDEFYTPPYAVKPIIKYIKPNSTIWCPFDTENSWFVKLFQLGGGNVIHTHIKDNEDFFTMEVPRCDYIISNPPYSCLTPDHEVLTKNGWKPIYDIKESDYVLTTDYNKNISWQQNNHLVVKEVEETTYEFSSKYLDLQVTQEHRMFAYNKSGELCINKNTKDLAVAKEVCQSWYQPRTGWNWEGKNESFFTLPETYVSNGHTEVYKPPINIPILDWVKFFGLWIADGSTRQTKNTYNKPRYTISVKQHDKTADKAFEIISALPFSVKVYSDGNKKNIEIHNKQLWEYLSIFGKSKDKFVPDFIKNGSKEILQVFMEGYSFGDSYKIHYKNNESTVLSTISKKLSEDLQEILLKLGRIVPVVTQKYRRKEIYSLTVSKDTTFSNKMNYGKPNLTYYKGKVYCLQLQNNSVFLVRRNGKICFTGNCKTEVLERLFAIGKPFAMLVGVVGLFESQRRFNMFKNNEFEIMYLNKRVSYFKDYADQKPSLNPPFSSVYVCHKMLPKQIVFEEIQKR